MIRIGIPARYLLILLTFLHTVNLYVDRAVISAARDPILAELELSLTEWGWVMAAFTLGYALFQTPVVIWPTPEGPDSC